MSKFEDMTVAELKNVAKDIGLTGYSKMRKQELIDALTSTIPQDGKDPVGRSFDKVDDVQKPVAFANRAMRRKAAYRAKLAMRHARRNGRQTMISKADWEFAEKVSA